MITNNIAISGPSGEHGIVLSRGLGSVFRFFHVATNGTLSLQNLTLTKGEARGFDGGMVLGGTGGGAAGMGGAVFSDGGTMVVVNSTLSGNLAEGGSSFNFGTTPGSGGGGGGLGGAIFQRGGSLTITNCTIATNIVVGGVGETNGFGEAGGILVLGDGSTVNFSMNNTIVARSGGATYDLFATNINSGTVNDSGSGNLVESAQGVSLSIVSNADPLLGVLSDNRGPTFTHALLDGSPAIDAGVANGLANDQRILFVRIADGDLNGSAEIDIGSFELLFKDYGDAPDFGSGTGTNEVFQSVGSEAFRISVMGNDAESNNTQRTRFEAINPDIAYNAAGNEVLVVWYGEDDTAPLVDNEDEIHGVRIDAETGERLGNQFRISFMGNDTETNQFVRDDFRGINPAVVWNPVDNGYLVVWYGEGDQNGLVDNEFEIFGQRIDATGGLVGNRIRVSRMGTDGLSNFAAFNPDVTHNATDNEYLVVWQADDNTVPVVDNENEIYAQRISGAGALVASRLRVSFQGNDAETDATQRTRSRPSDTRVTWNSVANQYLVVWEGDTDVLPTIDNENEIWGSILNNVGGVINGNFRISVMGPNGSTLYRADNPDVSYNSTDNQYLVVWNGDHNQNGLIDGETEIFGKVLNASGGTVADQFRISDMGPDQVTSFFASSATADYNPDLDLNSYSVIWRGDNLIDNKFEVFGQRLSSAGVEIGENDFFIGNTGPADDTLYSAQNPAVAFGDAQQEHLVIWEGDDDTFPLIDNEKEVFGQRILDGVVVDYATFDSDSGPSHFGSLTLRIGSLLDSEADGQPGLLADGDDTTGLDDEDGITSVVEYFPNGFFTLFVDVFNSLGSNATLYGWMDLDVDGVFELSERRSATITNGTAGPVPLDWGFVSSTATNNTYLRLRLSSDSAAGSPSGEAFDGEVEDHLIVPQPASGLGLPVITVTTLPTLLITNAPSIVVEGEANRHAVAINWTNSLTGASGTFSPNSIWSSGSIPLSNGDNQLTFTGTNLLGDVSTALLLIQVEGDCNENGISDPTEPDGFSVAPVGRWQFEESNGTVALDGVGSNDGTLIGGVTRTNGAQERGLSLDGTTGYVTIPDSDAVDFSANEDFAFAIWLKMPSNQISTVNGDNDIVEKWQGGGEGYPYVLRLLNQTTSSPGTVNVARYNGTDVVSVSSTNTINDDQWHHVAVSRNSGMLSIYIDGTLDGSIVDTITGVTENTSPIFLGRRGTGENPVTGSLDEFVVFGQGLSDAPVNELYRLGLGNGVVDECEAPFVDITQEGRDVGFLFSETALTGTTVNVTGDLTWSNSLTGGSGTIPASTNWQTTSPIAIGLGTNVITVSGANAARIVNSDQIIFTRGFLLDDGGATPLHYVSLTGGHVWPFTNWLDAATNVQTAVDTAFDGDTVLVTNGVYNVGGGPTPGGSLLNRVVVDRAITVRSVHGAAVTVLTGQGPIGATAVRGVYLGNNAILDGFTITNGFTRSLVGAVLNESGGGAYITGGGSMISCVVTRCSSSLTAGGIYGDAVGTIEDSTIVGNVSWLNAGGISLVNSGVISGCSISNNALTFANASRGGGVYMFGSGTLLTNSIISSNVAHRAGGAYVDDGDVILGTFQNNQAMGEGGGLILEEQATVSSSTFLNNSAVLQGGGLYRTGAELMAITNCHFISNTSGGSGGGIWSDGTFYLWHCMFRGNNAMTGSGGGIFSAGSCRFFNCLFTGNQAGINGGGIHGLVQFIKNTTMSGNKALGEGGALGVFNNFQTAAMENTILWDNQAAGVSDTVSASFANVSTGQSSFQNCLVDNAYNSGTWDLLLGSDLGSNFDVSPEFVQPLSPASSPSTNGNFRLTGESPIINQGNDALVNVAIDLDGNPRIQLGNVDVGAYETSIGSLNVNEISVYGNGVPLTHLDTTPTSVDHTDFGPRAVVAGTSTRTFTIVNTGSGTLTLGSSNTVSVSGFDVSDFTITEFPPASIPSLGTGSFTIAFDPSTTGVRTTDVFIANNDSNEGPFFQFRIQGTGEAIPLAADDFFSRSYGTNVLTIAISELLVNDVQSMGGVLSVSMVDAVSSSGGSVMLDGTNIVYVPSQFFGGVDSFTYTLVETPPSIDATGTVFVTTLFDDCNDNQIPDDLETDGYNVQSGAVGVWPFEEGTNTISADLVNGNDVTANIALNDVQWASGRRGFGLEFTGGFFAATIPDADAIDFGPSNDFSIILWAHVPTNQQDTSSTHLSLLSKEGGGRHSHRIRIENIGGANPGRVVADRHDGSGLQGAVNSTTSIMDGRWHHIAMVRSNSMMKLYIDGVLEDSTPDNSTGETRNTDPLYLGRIPTLFQERFTGRLDELAIYDRGLSDEEVTRVFEVGLGDGFLDGCPPVFEKYIADQNLTGTNALFNADPDEDGAKNGYEWATGFIATNSASFPELEISITGSTPVVRFTRNPQATDVTIFLDVYVDGATNIVGDGWSHIATNRLGVWASPLTMLEETGTGTNTPIQVEAFDERTNQSAIFYRLNVTQP